MRQRRTSHPGIWLLGVVVTASMACGRDATSVPATAPSGQTIKPQQADTPPATTAPTTQPTTAPATQPTEYLRPAPPAARMHVQARHAMVDRQIANPRDDRLPVTNERVLEAMRTVPRHVFVPAGIARLAHADRPLAIGHDQTTSHPFSVALRTELLAVTPQSRILEIGTGSGYQAAVLAHLTPHVYTIEIVAPLGRTAARVLKEQGYDEVHCRIGDGYRGWPEAAPFDGILVTCAAEDIPRPLWDQLRPGGRIVIPVGPEHQVQNLVVVHKRPDGGRRTETISTVRFVPMTGEAQRQ